MRQRSLPARLGSQKQKNRDLPKTYLRKNLRLPGPFTSGLYYLNEFTALLNAEYDYVSTRYHDNDLFRNTVFNWRYLVDLSSSTCALLFLCAQRVAPVDERPLPSPSHSSTYPVAYSAIHSTNHPLCFIHLFLVLLFISISLSRCFQLSYSSPDRFELELQRSFSFNTSFGLVPFENISSFAEYLNLI